MIMRLIFMGTPDFSVPALEALVEAGHEVVAAVTQPDKPKGRGRAVFMTPVKEKAVFYQIPVLQPVKARDPEFIEKIKQLKPDAIVVVAFGQILTKEFLEIPPYGCINIHASLLPKYRGAAPIQWAVINGEEQSGITTMMMDAGIDTGDMLETETVVLSPEETGGSLYDRLSQIGSRLIVSTLKKLEEGTLKAVPQPKTGASYAQKITKELGDIDWSLPAVSIERLIRGLNPWPSAYSMYQGKTIKFWSAQVVDEEFTGIPGQVVQVGKDFLAVKTGQGTLSIKELQLEGKKRMDIQSFLRGYSIEKDSIFQRKEM